VRNKKFLIFALLILTLLGLWFGYHKQVVAPSHSEAPKTSPHTNTKPAASTTFDKSRYSLTDPTSIWVIVNKQHPLNPVTYVPSDLVYPNVPLASAGADNMHLRRESANAMEQMFVAAKKAGISLMLTSGYRSYSYQKTVYNGYVQTLGQAAADKQSARPGYSEHQTGWAADVEPTTRHCELDACFGDTPEGKWVAANSYKYGFIIRYQSNAESITGYEYEPWHVRYVGTGLSNEMHSNGIQTLEQFFNVSGGTTYKS
jgi:D-alanyl-D-alanine carboxypeptidase